MISADVRQIYSLEVDDLDHYAPADPTDFRLQVRIIVGPRQAPGEESFDLTVCTPKWIARSCDKDGFVLGRGYLIVCQYDFNHIKDVITTFVEQTAGNSWEDGAKKLARFALWEFEDYNPI